MTVAELISELQDAMDQDAQVFYTPWQRRCTTRGRVNNVVIADGGVYLLASTDGRADYVPSRDGDEIELYVGTR